MLPSPCTPHWFFQRLEPTGFLQHLRINPDFWLVTCWRRGVAASTPPALWFPLLATMWKWLSWATSVQSESSWMMMTEPMDRPEAWEGPRIPHSSQPQTDGAGSWLQWIEEWVGDGNESVGTWHSQGPWLWGWVKTAVAEEDHKIKGGFLFVV